MQRTRFSSDHTPTYLAAMEAYGTDPARAEGIVTSHFAAKWFSFPATDGEGLLIDEGVQFVEALLAQLPREQAASLWSKILQGQLRQLNENTELVQDNVVKMVGSLIDFTIQWTLSIHPYARDAAAAIDHLAAAEMLDKLLWSAQEGTSRVDPLDRMLALTRIIYGEEALLAYVDRVLPMYTGETANREVAGPLIDTKGRVETRLPKLATRLQDEIAQTKSGFEAVASRIPRDDPSIETFDGLGSVFAGAEALAARIVAEHPEPAMPSRLAR